MNITTGLLALLPMIGLVLAARLLLFTATREPRQKNTETDHTSDAVIIKNRTGTNSNHTSAQTPTTPRDEP